MPRKESHPPARRGPGERAGLRLATVVAEARGIAASEGIEGLTMRRLADRLGVVPNTLYSHFADKNDLLDAVIDDVLGDVVLPDRRSVDWRDGLRALFVSSRQVLLAHPELVPDVLARATRGPNAIRLGEATLDLLADGGVEDTAAVDALRILLVYTFGFVAQESARRSDPDPGTRRARSAAAFRGRSDAPRMGRLAEPLADSIGDVAFEKGLAWLLDGIAATARSAITR